MKKSSWYYRARQGIKLPERWTCPNCGRKLFTAGGHAKVCGRSLESVFWSKVNKTDTCWLWAGGRTYAGHGQINLSVAGDSENLNKKVLVHRYSWELTYGLIPEGMQVLHKCDVPHCVNPAHLYLGTPKHNGADRTARGRNANGRGTRSKALPPQKYPRSKNEPRNV